jgi:hypothetical protein
MNIRGCILLPRVDFRTALVPARDLSAVKLRHFVPIGNPKSRWREDRSQEWAIAKSQPTQNQSPGGDSTERHLISSAGLERRHGNSAAKRRIEREQTNPTASPTQPLGPFDNSLMSRMQKQVVEPCSQPTAFQLQLKAHHRQQRILLRQPGSCDPHRSYRPGAALTTAHICTSRGPIGVGSQLAHRSNWIKFQRPIESDSKAPRASQTCANVSVSRWCSAWGARSWGTRSWGTRSWSTRSCRACPWSTCSGRACSFGASWAPRHAPPLTPFLPRRTSLLTIGAPALTLFRGIGASLLTLFRAGALALARGLARGLALARGLVLALGLLHARRLSLSIRSCQHRSWRSYAKRDACSQKSKHASTRDHVRSSFFAHVQPPVVA